MRRENLVAPMLHGRKRVDGVSATRVVPAWRAVVLLLLSTLAVAALIVWGSSTA
jgi:hypothetical protein